MAEKISFPLLNNGNYSTWKVRMEMLLTRDDYWFAVEDPKPEPVTSDWRKANQKALATIVLFLEDSQMNLVKGVTTARDAWTKLKSYHEKASMTSRVSLLKRICSLNLVEGRAEGPDMERHLYELDELFDRLQCAGQVLEPSLKIAMVLRSLPDSYDVLVTALESRKDEDLTMEIVKQKLLDEWQRRTERSVSSSFGTGESALKSVAKRQEEKVCFHCRKPGHFRRNCRLFLKQRGDDDEGTAEAKQATEKERSVCFAVRKNRQKGRWIIDSGCSGHMTNDKEFFSKLEKADVDVVLADGSVVKAAGVGEGSIQCIDGAGNPKKIFVKNVLFIPSLYSGLLSVRTLLQKGFKVEFGASSCSIVGQAGGVVALGELRENLFELKMGRGLPKNEAKCLPSCSFVRSEKPKKVNVKQLDSGSGDRSQEELKVPQESEEFQDCEDEDFEYWMKVIDCRRNGLLNNQVEMGKMRVSDASATQIESSQYP